MTGRSVKARQVLKLGMIDDAVPNSILLETAAADAALAHASGEQLASASRVI
ncbi:hypothetical protein [Candidatus Symbiopectobacterium sp.]|uniref:hypothetical protein n=1 Tax=Candidatus Symbiopectobacterium sp. TaxID=2816440 RepID=UPI0025BB0AC9|nr:hypothetical protein [Candidatus Symbiopectobacterium sp.]